MKFLKKLELLQLHPIEVVWTIGLVLGIIFSDNNYDLNMILIPLITLISVGFFNALFENDEYVIGMTKSLVGSVLVAVITYIYFTPYFYKSFSFFIFNSLILCVIFYLGYCFIKVRRGVFTFEEMVLKTLKYLLYFILIIIFYFIIIRVFDLVFHPDGITSKIHESIISILGSVLYVVFQEDKEVINNKYNTRVLNILRIMLYISIVLVYASIFIKLRSYVISDVVTYIIVIGIVVTVINLITRRRVISVVLLPLYIYGLIETYKQYSIKGVVLPPTYLMIAFLLILLVVDITRIFRLLKDEWYILIAAVFLAVIFFAPKINVYSVSLRSVKSVYGNIQGKNSRLEDDINEFLHYIGEEVEKQDKEVEKQDTEVEKPNKFKVNNEVNEISVEGYKSIKVISVGYVDNLSEEEKMYANMLINNNLENNKIKIIPKEVSINVYKDGNLVINYMDIYVLEK